MFCGIIWEGPIYGFTGYARSRSLALELYNLGINVKLSPSFSNKVLIKDYQLFKKLETSNIDCDKCAIVNCDVPFNLKRKSKNFSIAYTMFETSDIHKHWAKEINKFDRLWVPNKWNKTNFENSGVSIPIDVVPFGVDLDLFTPVRKREREFTFLFVGVYLERKNWMMLHDVFCSKFKDREDIRIIFKFSGDVKSLKIKDHNNVNIINEPISDFELAKLYRESDCVVLPSYAEGIGLPILEGYASGLPAIFTHAPFFKDFVSDDVSFPVCVSKMVRPSQEFTSINRIYKDSYFYKICPFDLEKKMDEVVKAKNLKDKCREFAKDFSWKTSASKAIRILDKL